MVALAIIVVPPDLRRRILRRALACARRIVAMRRERQCESYLLVWPDLRRDADGWVTNLRFRLGPHPDALKLASTHRPARLAAILEWHASECFIRGVISEWMGNTPLLAASDAELVALLDVLPLNACMDVWAQFAEKELEERENESGHRKLLRYSARMTWLKAQEKSN